MRLHSGFWRQARERAGRPFDFEIEFRQEDSLHLSVESNGKSKLVVGPGSGVERSISNYANILGRVMPELGAVERERLAVGVAFHHEESHYRQNKFTAAAGQSSGARTQKEDALIDEVSRQGLIDKSRSTCDVEGYAFKSPLKDSVPLELMPAPGRSVERMADIVGVLNMRMFGFSDGEILKIANGLDYARAYRDGLDAPSIPGASLMQSKSQTLMNKLRDAQDKTCEKEKAFADHLFHGFGGLQETVREGLKIPVNSEKRLDEFAKRQANAFVSAYIGETPLERKNPGLGKAVAARFSKISDTCEEKYKAKIDGKDIVIKNPGGRFLAIEELTWPIANRPHDNHIAFGSPDIKSKLLKMRAAEQVGSCLVPIHKNKP